MDYDATDRAASRYVLTAVRNGTRFYIADNVAETATDIAARARVYRDGTDARLASLRLSREFAWPWEPMPAGAAR